MLARIFHAWERRLAFTTKDRTVRPFDWGADWISPTSGPDSRADAQVERWVEEVMRDTPAFFDAPPTSDFAFSANGARARVRGEAGTLTFPSALTTPHPQNNVVAARWFPAAGDEALTHLSSFPVMRGQFP